MENTLTSSISYKKGDRAHRLLILRDLLAVIPDDFFEKKDIGSSMLRNEATFLTKNITVKIEITSD